MKTRELCEKAWQEIDGKFILKPIETTMSVT